MKKQFLFSVIILFLMHASAKEPQAESLTNQLNEVRSKRLMIEKTLMGSQENQKATTEQTKRLRTLKGLQVQEKKLTEKRLVELQAYLTELANRKADVLKRIRDEQFSLKSKISSLIHPILYRREQWIRGDQGEAEAQLKRHVFSQLVLSELKDLESLNADLQDAEDIASRIAHEQDQMSALLQDLKEQENIIQFHQKLREAQSEQSQAERLKQLAEYRDLRNSEIEIERMIGQFQARQDQERDSARKKIPILPIRPKSLPWPLKGKVVGVFGSHKDSQTGLMIFNKGIEIQVDPDPSGQDVAVLSVADGIIQFAGSVPGKGNVMIVEHPRDLYTVYAGLVQLGKKVGETVQTLTPIGVVLSQQSFYFEIRSRNLAIDPLKWLK